MSDSQLVLIQIRGDVADINAKLADVKGYIGKVTQEAEKLRAKSADLASDIKRLAVQFVSLGSALAAVKAGFSFLATIETATLGIGSAFMTGGKYIDETSKKALSAQDALDAAQGDSKKIIEELQYANLQTIATLDELIVAYQTTLPVALSRGFNREQVKEFTVAMVQAAGAIGLQMNQMAEETRSILTGAIDPRTSRIATVLGLRNEDIRQFQGNADALFAFLMEKLSAYKVAGVESQNTWAGLWSNFKDIALQSMGKGLDPLFEAVKYELKSIAESIVTIDDQAKKIRWNPEFLEGVKSFRNGIQDVIAEVYRLGMLLDKIGGSYARLMQALTFSEGADDRWVNMNEMYRQRYMKSEKALQDMAMHSQGWKPVTAEIDKQMREAALQGKKTFAQTQVNVGEPGNYTQQLLRYYRKGGTGAEWKPNELRDDSLKKLQENWKDTLRDLEADIKKSELGDAFDKESGLDVAFEKKLIDIYKKAADLKDKFAKLPGAAKKIDLWADAMGEGEAGEAAKKDFDEYLQKLHDQRKLEKDTAAERKKAAKELTVTREADINSQIASLDVAEKEGTFHRDTIEERIRLMDELKSIQEDYLTTINKHKDPASWYAQTNAINATKTKLLELKTESQPVTAALRKYGDEATDMWKQLGDVVGNAFKGMEDALLDFCKTGKISFKGLVDSIISDLLRMFIRTQITGPASAWLGSAMQAGGGLGGVLGMFGWQANATEAQLALQETQAASYGMTAYEFYGAFHSGGMGNEPTFYRLVPNLDRLPRYHKGLGPGERLSITTDDEMTLTPGQQKRIVELVRASESSGSPDGRTGDEDAGGTIINNNNFFINAMDPRSFEEYIKRNPGPIEDAIDGAIRGNAGLRGTIRRYAR